MVVPEAAQPSAVEKQQPAQEAQSAEAANAHIQLYVKDRQGHEVPLNIKKTTHTKAVRRVLPPHRSAGFAGSLHGTEWGAHRAR